jgi:hypothetical protein
VSDALRQRVLAHVTRDPRPGETRTYLVRDEREAHPTALPVTVSVVVSAACGRCGKARGEPTERTVHDASTDTDYEVSVWRNPCGHPDLHRDILTEAELYRLAREA